MTLKQTELEWRQPDSRHRRYELAANSQLIATLRFEKLGGTLATGECGPNRWTFKRTGFLSPKVSIRVAGSDNAIAMFAPSWTGSGWLAFDSGRRYHLRATNFWATEWAFESEDGTRVIALFGPHGVFKQGGHAHVAESALSLPETPVLLLLIWYLRVLMNEDASAAAVIAACS